MRSDHDALLRAVIDSPDDDAPRLVYADWCEENGDPERAEYIRVQIAIERAASGRRKRELEVRAEELSSFEDRWTTQFDDVVLPESARPWLFRRGFVEELELTATSFVHHADWLFDLTPLRGLRLPHRPDIPMLVGQPALERIRSLEFDVDPPCEPEGLLALLSSDSLARVERLAFIDDPDRWRYDGLPRFPSDTCDTLAANTHMPRLRHLVFFGLRWHSFDSVLTAPWVNRLTTLAIVECGLNYNDVVRIVDCPGLSNLRVLELSENYIGEDGLRYIAESPRLDHLNVLDIKSTHHDFEAEFWGTEFDGYDDPATPSTIALLKKKFGPRLRI